MNLKEPELMDYYNFHKQLVQTFRTNPDGCDKLLSAAIKQQEDFAKAAKLALQIVPNTSEVLMATKDTTILMNLRVLMGTAFVTCVEANKNRIKLMMLPAIADEVLEESAVAIATLDQNYKDTGFWRQACELAEQRGDTEFFQEFSFKEVPEIMVFGTLK